MDRLHIKKGLQAIMVDWVETFNDGSRVKAILEYDAADMETSVVLDNLTDYVIDIIEGVGAKHYNTD